MLPILTLNQFPTPIELPLFGSKIPAEFPSHADYHLDSQLLIKIGNLVSTFFVRVSLIQQHWNPKGQFANKFIQKPLQAPLHSIPLPILAIQLFVASMAALQRIQVLASALRPTDQSRGSQHHLCEKRHCR